MDKVTREQVIAALQAVGIQPGENLLIHSAIQFFGIPVGGIEIYLQALLSVLGTEGTIAVPTFNFAFARGEPYDPQKTPSENMGAFSEFMRQLPNARRTPHPLQSLAMVGRHAADLTGWDTPSAFDPGSAFERLLELDFKLLLLGASVLAVSLIHYCEQRADVPYRYWKDFHGLVRAGENWEMRTYRMFVRDLELNPRLTLDPVQKELQNLNRWNTVSLNYGSIASCQLIDFVAAADRLLAADPWALVIDRGVKRAKYEKLHGFTSLTDS